MEVVEDEWDEDAWDVVDVRDVVDEPDNVEDVRGVVDEPGNVEEPDNVEDEPEVTVPISPMHTRKRNKIDLLDAHSVD